MSVKATDRKAGTYTVCELIEHSTSFEDAAAVIIQPTKSYSKPIRQTISFSIGSRENDLVVACYAHSGGDVILRICHLLRVADAGPIDRNAVDNWKHDNAKESAENEMHLPFRVFRSNKPLLELASELRDVKYIATIRDPFDVFLLYYDFAKKTGALKKENALELDMLEFAFSSEAGQHSLAGEYFRQLAALWHCRMSKNLLLIPFEDLVANRAKWITIIAEFVEIPCNPALLKEIVSLTAKDYMRTKITGFSDNWVVEVPSFLSAGGSNIAELPRVSHGIPFERKSTVGALTKRLLRRKWLDNISCTWPLVVDYPTMRKELFLDYFPSSRVLNTVSDMGDTHTTQTASQTIPSNPLAQPYTRPRAMTVRTRDRALSNHRMQTSLREGGAKSSRSQQGSPIRGADGDSAKWVSTLNIGTKLRSGFYDYLTSLFVDHQNHATV